MVMCFLARSWYRGLWEKTRERSTEPNMIEANVPKVFSIEVESMKERSDPIVVDQNAMLQGHRD